MTTPVNVNELNSNDFQRFVDSFDHVFTDCDGVLWSEGPLPGSGDFINIMKQLGKTVHFVSNNSLRSKTGYENQFKSANIENGFENLTIPSTAIAEYLKSVNFDKHIYCMTCKQTQRVLESYGFKCKYGPDELEDEYTNYVKYLEDDPDIGAVVVDSDFKVNFGKMYKAITYLRRQDVLFINGATDKYVPLKRGLLALGPTVLTDYLATETNREPVLLAKPSKEFGMFAMKRAGVTDASRVLFIGDMIQQDIALGKAVGFQTLLVLTNISKEDMLLEKKIQPDNYTQSLGSLVPMLKQIDPKCKCNKINI